MAKVVQIYFSQDCKVIISLDSLLVNQKEEIASLFFDYGCNILYQNKNVLKTDANDFCIAATDLYAFFLKNKIKVKQDGKVSRLISEIKEFNKPSKGLKEKALFKLSKNFKRTLTKHQIRNVKKLLQNNHGASFSVPGAGKTTEALALLDAKRNTFPCLVICPKNAFASWEEQISVCLKKGKVLRIISNSIDEIKNNKPLPNYLLITYSRFSNISDKLLPFLAKNDFNIILDESHKIKRGAEGKWGSEVLKAAPHARSRIILSGTPLPNSEEDLVPQIKFLFPHLKNIYNPGNFIKRFYVRTTKKELNLPKLYSRLIPVKLSSKQKCLYEIIKNKFARDQKGIFDISDRETLRKINKCYMRLLQVISNPLLLLKSDIEFNNSKIYDLFEEGPKIMQACKRAREITKLGQKVIIWSYFKENINLIASHLSDLNAVLIYGDTNIGDEDEEDTREFRIKKFKTDSSCSVLVANPAACGESISLHLECHFALYVDRTYNAAHYLQSQDRIHRYGLPKNTRTFIEILYAKNTIDESINRRLIHKTARMASILSDPSLNIEPEDEDDFSISDSKDAADFLKTVIKK